jgi:hypothetical protein
MVSGAHALVLGQIPAPRAVFAERGRTFYPQRRHIAMWLYGKFIAIWLVAIGWLTAARMRWWRASKFRFKKFATAGIHSRYALFTEQHRNRGSGRPQELKFK